ncbi:unnamed protein product [Bemisia tabaci]|uniref:Protein-lysine methyltransferase METTL21D n=1 Tax=Bemisia tabaci TaxID=7038 RepID=A0A9P0AHN1_BEMTA|nr:unnamed protein product [Bemisia tabaci]
MDDFFVRKLDIETINKSLDLYQCTIGDVGCVVWDAALVLSKYLEVSCAKSPWLQGRKILELGAGVGCVGIVAACLGGDVIVTDLPEILPLLEKNISANFQQIEGTGGKISAQTLRWGDAENIKLLPKPDIILMADVIYYEESVEALVSTLLLLSDKNTTLILCHEKRQSEKQKEIFDAFYKRAKEHFKFSAVPPSEQHPDYCCQDFYLLKVSLLTI